MQTIDVQYSQTLNDIALQVYGSVIYATDIANANSIVITDDVSGGTIVLPDIEITDDELKIVQQIKKLNSPIASKYPL